MIGLKTSQGFPSLLKKQRAAQRGNQLIKSEVAKKAGRLMPGGLKENSQNVGEEIGTRSQRTPAKKRPKNIIPRFFLTANVSLWDQTLTP